MLPFLVFIAVVGGLLWRGTSQEQRLHAWRRLLEMARVLWHAAVTPPPGGEPFQHALRARTRWAFVTPALAAAQVIVFLGVMVGPGEFADPQTLVQWGANVGLRTTNGEWWRLATTLFVHWGMIHLVADLAGLLQAGLLMERLVGPIAFGSVYLVSGLLAGVATISAQPVDVHAGAAGAVFGVYGLVLASLVWGLAQRSVFPVPPIILKRLWPGALTFALYNAIANDVFSESMQAGLVAGFVAGMVVCGRVISRKPPLRRVCATLAATLAIVVMAAAPLRGLADVTGEVELVRQAEARMATTYDAAVVRFKRGRLDADQLARLAEANAREFQPVRERLGSIRNVPDVHQPLLAYASEYARLREESWRLRAEGLRTGRLRMLQQADVVENAALAALRTLDRP